MPNLNIPLTNLGIDTITLLPDGTEYITGQYHAIGERKRVRWRFSTAYNMESVNIWVQFAIFNQGILNSLTPKNPIDHTFTFPIGLAAGTYPMALILPIGANPFLNRNLDAYIEIIDATHFNIMCEFYQIYDELVYQNQSGQDNHNKLLRDIKTSPTDLTVGTAKSCYNSNASSFCITVRLEKDNQVHPPDPYPYTDNGNPAIGFTWMAGFYNKDANVNPSYFTVPQFYLQRSALPVSNLMATQDTQVIFRVSSPTNVSKILMWIIRTDKFDNTVMMVDNYEANFEDIDTSNPNIGTGTNKFIGPVQNPTAIGSGTYEARVSIKGTNLQNGGKYRLIAIVYDDAVPHVNSFISEEYTADGLPCYEGNGFDVRAALDDYNKQYEGNNLECCIEERMRSKIKLDFAFDKWKNDLYNRLGLVTGNDIRRYLTNVSVSIYETYNDPSFGNIINIFDYKTSAKIGVNSYTAQTGMTMAFGNNWAEFHYEWRNRFESWIPCVATLVNNVNTIPVFSTQYWGGKNLVVKWTFTFEYDDYIYAFSEDIVVNQYMRVKNYGGMRIITEEEEDREKNSFCLEDEICFVAETNDPDLEDRKLIVNVVPVTGSITSIEEAEAWEGNQLSQMTTPKIINEDEDYALAGSDLQAKFCIDANEFLLNSQYTISAMAKRYEDTGKRITEDLQPRITENNDRRTIDNL